MSISRVSLCSFTFADGRRCRTPRSSKHPELCYFHAKKEAEARFRRLATTSVPGSPAITSRPAISAPLWVASFPIPPRAGSSHVLPQPWATSVRPLPSSFLAPSSSTSTPTAPTPGEPPSVALPRPSPAPPSGLLPPLPPRSRQPRSHRQTRNPRLQSQPPNPRLKLTSTLRSPTRYGSSLLQSRALVHAFCLSS